MPQKLIIVSNREPYFIKRAADGRVVTQPSTGGLVAALEPLLRAHGGVWISWSGFEREAPKSGEPLPERVELTQNGGAPCAVRCIPLTEREASLYYYGFAHRALWPLCHQFLGKVDFDAEAWRAYKRVNQRFADAVLEESGDDDARVWIHDFHLALVPGMLRAARPQMQIGFSWHAPWPPADTLRALPWAQELLDGILGANAIGFQLERHARHFADTVREVSERDVTDKLIIAPMGVDATQWGERARAARGGRAIRLRRNLSAERLVLAVDRVDFTRGIMERLDAVGHFFDRYPSYRGRVVFCQIAVPSRTRGEAYREMKKSIDDKVSAINARFQNGSWQPIRYVYRNLEPDELAVYYVGAEVMLATPLREGINLPVLEYIAARINEDGAVVLSSLSGAADVLPESLLVNPNSSDLVAAALRTALEMEPAETRQRMSALRNRVSHMDVTRWRREFSLRAFGDELEPPAETSTSVEATM